MAGDLLMRTLLSVVIVVYDMPRQALNTIRSFSAGYQRDVGTADFEIIVVENESQNLLGAQAAQAVADNVRYFLQPNEGHSPVPALQFGVEQSRGDSIGLVVDGARMVTPRVLSLALAAFRITPHAIVSVPGYHLGRTEQHRNPNHDERAEKALLEHIDWLTDGYRLFEASVFFRGRHQHGFLLPLMESNCVFFSREAYTLIGGVDTRFDMPGGGMVNLDLYKRLVERPEAQLFVTPGEGTFHQFHGGVTTKVDDKREQMLADFRDQYLAIRGEPYTMPDTAPRLLGPVPGWALPMLEFSASCGVRALLPA
jgi:hypothetical protein